MNGRHLPGSPPYSAAGRLLWLEARDQAISRRLHDLTRERTKNRDEALRLRCQLTARERAEYESATRR